jgi:predicted enzyme related to lactoylglutathione lyase
MSDRNVVSWFEISVTDMDRAKKFYEAVTGKKLNKMPVPEEMGITMYAFDWTDDGAGAAGALVKSEQGKPGGSGTLVYFDSEDCSELNRVEAAGGKVIMEKAPVEGFGFFGFCTDTEGNTIGFFSNN